VRRFFAVALALLLAPVAAWAADTDTPKAAATRKKLQDKVTVEYKESMLREVLDDLKEQVKGLTTLEDTKGGVSLNSRITYKAKDKPAAEVLSDICDKYDLGWFIISNTANGYDGSVRITKGKERGYEAGKEPDKTAADKPKTDTKPKPDDKKPDDKKPAAKDDPEQAEQDAARKLKLAKELIDDKPEKAKERLQELIKQFPKTKAAEEAKQLLEKLGG
jgi:hypothetical protein